MVSGSIGPTELRTPAEIGFGFRDGTSIEGIVPHLILDTKRVCS